MREKNKSCTLHQYVTDDERIYVDPWIGECSTGRKRKDKWKPERRTTRQYGSDCPVEEFDEAEVKGENTKVDDSEHTQRRSTGEYDRRERPSAVKLILWFWWMVRGYWARLIHWGDEEEREEPI
jgi:hypothetical protein